MILGVAGLGVVGSALAEYLQCEKHIIKRYDPAKGFTDDLSDCDFVFICVSAPTTVMADWPVDVSNIKDVISRFGNGPKYFIRSTVTPGTTDMLRKQYGSDYHIYSMPEFVSEKTALSDMATMPIITDYKSYMNLGAIFCKDRLLSKRLRITGYATECELAKYAHNVFGALKVSFFNIIAGACEYEGVSYDKVKEHVLSVGHMDRWYTKVPGPDGSFGFGGTCFPKDTAAFKNYLREIEADLEIPGMGSSFLFEMLAYNNLRRG